MLILCGFYSIEEANKGIHSIKKVKHKVWLGISFIDNAEIWYNWGFISLKKTK